MTHQMQLKNGLWQLIPSPVLTSVLLSRDLDFVIIDFEHGNFTLETLVLSVFAAKAAGKKLFVRVSSASSDLVSQILDCNVDGVLFAHIESECDVKLATSKFCYYPLGNRSYTPFSYSSCYNNPEFTACTPHLGILIESEKGIRSLTTILASASVDFVYFGAYDLSVEIGLSGQIFHSTLIDMLRLIYQDCSRSNVPLWALARNSEEASLLNSCGVSVILRGVDTGLIADAVSFSANLSC